METFLGVLSAILGFMGIMQWIIGYTSGNSLRAKQQSAYNQWYRVAELAEQIRNEPVRAIELAAAINGLADGVRSEIVAYSRERLDFVPSYESSARPIDNVPHPRGLWAKIRLGFSAK